MDFEQFKKQLDAARAVELAVDGVRFTVTLPTDGDMAIAAEDSRSSEGRYNHVRAMRSVLMQGVKGWSGVTAEHILPGSGTETIDFSAGALGALIDARQDLFAGLVSELVQKRAERLARREEAEKN